ncbi:MAG: 3-hydroxyacyl-ACP dehydratase FabZ [Pseudomonadota bacterium]
MATDEAETTAEYVEELPVDQVMRMLPHRYPFLLLDRVRQLRPAHSAVGLKNVTINEPFFPGHFPPKPIMPGVLIVEAMAQTAAVLVVHTLDLVDKGKLVYFMTIDNTRFRKPVVPGDAVNLHVEVMKSRGPVWKFSGVARTDGEICAQSEFSAMIVDEKDVIAGGRP